MDVSAIHKRLQHKSDIGFFQEHDTEGDIKSISSKLTPTEKAQLIRARNLTPHLFPRHQMTIRISNERQKRMKSIH